MIEHICTSDGIPTGTRFEFYTSSNTLLIATVDSRGQHEVELSGIEAVQLRAFLTAQMTATGRRPR